MVAPRPRTLCVLFPQANTEPDFVINKLASGPQNTSTIVSTLNEIRIGAKALVFAPNPKAPTSLDPQEKRSLLAPTHITWWLPHLICFIFRNGSLCGAWQIPISLPKPRHPRMLDPALYTSPLSDRNTENPFPAQALRIKLKKFNTFITKLKDKRICTWLF